VGVIDVDEEDKSIKKAYQLGALGVGIAAQVVAGALIGYYLDRKFHTQPGLMLLGTVGCFFYALRTLFRALKRF
jgi:F0F1-type ATP synthase assembly protein I